MHSTQCTDKISLGDGAGFWAWEAWHVLAETALAALALEDGLAQRLLFVSLPTSPA